MKVLNKVQFLAQGYDTINRYDSDNRWFQFLSGGLWEKSWKPGEYVLTAAACYAKVDATTMKMLLLGDDKIRRDSDLVDTFSLSTAMQGLEKDVQDLVNRKEAERGNVAAAAAPPSLKDTRGFAPNEVLPVAGAGAILATRGWSPMLNDAFILGGIHHNWDFFLGLAEVDRQSFQARSAPNRAPKDAWRHFLTTNLHMFWDDKRAVPRVFVRELIGLKSFGYKPDFNELQLGFKCVKQNDADGSSLVTYLDALAAAGFPESKRSSLLEAIGEFLFEDKTAFTSAKAA